MNETRNFVWYWNMIHYCIYSYFFTIRNWIRIGGPVYYWDKIPPLKRYFNKRGVDIERVVRTVTNNTRLEMVSIYAGVVMGGLVIFLIVGIFNCSQLLFTQSISQPISHWISKNRFQTGLFLLALIVPSFLLNYFVLFKQNKYLKYFKEFEKIDRTTIKRYYFFSFVIIAILSTFFFISQRFTK